MCVCVCVAVISDGLVSSLIATHECLDHQFNFLPKTIAMGTGCRPINQLTSTLLGFFGFFVFVFLAGEYIHYLLSLVMLTNYLFFSNTIT